MTSPRAFAVRRPLPVILAVGLTLAGLGWWWRSSVPEPPPSSGTPSVAATAPSLAGDFTFGWAPGWRYRYGFKLDQDSSTRLFADLPDTAVQTLEARVQLAGELVVEPLAGDALPAPLRLRLALRQPHRMEIAGRELLSEEVLAAADPARVLVTLGAEGGIATLQAEGETPEPLVRVFHLLLSEWQMHFRGGLASWQVREQTQHGVVDSVYRVASVDPAGRQARVERARARYLSLSAAPGASPHQQLDHQASMVVSLDGYPLELLASEALQVATPQGTTVLRSQLSTSLTLLAREAMPVVVAAAGTGPAQPLMGFADREQLDRAHLQQRIAGLSAAQLLSDLRQHAGTGRLPDHNRWLWRATGLLQAQPELAAELAAFARQSQIAHEARGLALDLLAAAGTPEAQAALLRVLSTDALREHPRYPVYLQRLSFVKQPGDEVLAFLQQTAADTEGITRAAAQNALGAAANHRDRNGDHDRAAAIAAQLAQELARCSDPVAQAYLIEAIGNAGLGEQAILLRPYAASVDSGVRFAVASALRKMQQAPSTQTLLDLSSDAEARVASRALQSLGRHPLGEGELGQLHSLVATRQVPEPAYPTLVNVLQPLLAANPQVRSIFELILQQPLADASVKTRLRALLGL